MKNTRSPLKDKPLRLPGESIAAERAALIESAIGEPALLALLFIVIAGLEWWRAYTGRPPQPWVFSLAAVISILYAAFRIWRALPQLRNLRQALDGERAVGQFLERLREQGFHVFHDVVGTGFNIDHVIVGPAGAFTIETKTWSKPSRGRAEITFDGEVIVLAGRSPDRDPVIQARAQSTWLRSLLRESTGKDFPVRPVIVFPGWFIVNTGRSFHDVWVLEPKALPAFLNNEPERLRGEEVKLASFHLSRAIRGAAGSR